MFHEHKILLNELFTFFWNFDLDLFCLCNKLTHNKVSVFVHSSNNKQIILSDIIHKCIKIYIGNVHLYEYKLKLHTDSNCKVCILLNLFDFISIQPMNTIFYNNSSVKCY